MVDGAIRVNLAGREPNGLVQPGRQYDAVCRRIADALGTIVDVDTGRQIVARVVRTRDVYRGERLAALPDLWVEWRKLGHVHRVESPLIGRVERDWDGCRTGDHRPGGRVLISGPHVRPGRLDRPVPVIDLAPTVAAMLGVVLPDVDGTPVPELVRGRVHAAA
jgi:predicted AlkP superfamily phosphohydrolase/phosphomutase